VVLSSSIFLALSLPLVVLGGAGANYSHFLLFVGVLAFSGAFHAFGAIDAGGVMCGMGASRHMLIMCLSQPTLILVFLALAIRADTSLIDGMIMGAGVFGGPSFVLAALALMLIGLAENDRYPADNPETSLELTMIREAMVFHYSGPYLVMMDYAAMLKLVTFFLLVTNILSPFGLMTAESGVLGILLAALLAVVKVLLASLAVAIFESVVAKMRFYRLQEFLSGAFFIAFAAFALALVMP
jgi:formate hydrogenlyase subunit 4